MSWAEAACHIVRGRPLALIDNQRAFLWRAASLNRREGCWPASLTVYSPWQTSAAALNWKQEEEEFKTITSQRERERESFHYERSSLRFVTSCSRFSCVARLQLFRLTESIWRKKKRTLRGLCCQDDDGKIFFFWLAIRFPRPAAV